MKQLSSTSNFKIYSKRILAFLLALVVLYAMAAITADALDTHFDTRNGSQKVTACQISDFYALAEDSLDVIILGSSHAMCSYDPYAIEEEFGLTAFNLGTALQQPDTAYYLLREVLKTQKPKYLIYDVYFKVMLDEYSNEQVITVLKELHSSSNSRALFWDNLKMSGKVSYYNHWINPFARIQNVMENPSPRTDEKPAAYIGRGFYLSEGVVDPSLLEEIAHPFSTEYSGFNSRQVKYLKKLITLAQNNGITVILTSAPIPPTILSRVDYYDDVLAETKSIAELFNVPFIDFAEPSADILTDFDFADQGHLNRTGCAKFTEYFISQMKDILKKG